MASPALSGVAELSNLKASNFLGTHGIGPPHFECNVHANVPCVCSVCVYVGYCVFVIIMACKEYVSVFSSLALTITKNANHRTNEHREDSNPASMNQIPIYPPKDREARYVCE